MTHAGSAPAPFMDRPATRLWILRQLGAPVVPVHLTECQLDDALDTAYRWIAGSMGITKQGELFLIPGQPSYPLPDDVQTVVDLSQEQAAPPDYLGAAFFGFDGVFPSSGVPYFTASSAAVGGIYSSITQSFQNQEMARRILSLEEEWEQIERSLYFSPNPRQAKKVIYTYKPRDIDLRQLTPRQYNLYLQYALAQSMLILGRTYSRFDSFPTSDGQVSMNGESLLQQAADMIQDLENKLEMEKLPMPIVTG